MSNRPRRARAHHPKSLGRGRRQENLCRLSNVNWRESGFELARTRINIHASDNGSYRKWSVTLYFAHRDLEVFEFKHSYWYERPLCLLCGSSLNFHSVGSFQLNSIDEVPGLSSGRQVMRGPGINGCNIGARIECEPDKVFEIQDRGATLTHAEVYGGRGEQGPQPL